jgi:hypothetical protein
MIGVGIIGFDRPQYLRRTLAGLAQQDYAGDVEYHLFLDGAVNPFSGRTVGSQWGIDAAAQVFARSGLPNQQIHAQDDNLGIGLHQYQAIEWMTTHYERVMMVEDDVVLSPHWLRLAMGLVDKYQDREGIFGFSPGYKKQGTNEDALLYFWAHWLCETFTAQAWSWARLYYQDYLHLIDGVDYGYRDHEAIQAFYKRYGWVHPATSQDAAKDMAIHRAGMRRVSCEVNRAINIGRTGVHLNPALFSHLGFENQAPFTFDGDRTRTQFDEPVNAGTSTTEG